MKLVATWTGNPKGSEKYIVLGRDETCVVTVTLSQTSDAAPVPVVPGNAAKPAELAQVDPCPPPTVAPSVRALAVPRRGKPVPFTAVELAFDPRTRKYRARFVLGGVQISRGLRARQLSLEATHGVDKARLKVAILPSHQAAAAQCLAWAAVVLGAFGMLALDSMDETFPEKLVKAVSAVGGALTAAGLASLFNPYDLPYFGLTLRLRRALTAAVAAIAALFIGPRTLVRIYDATTWKGTDEGAHTVDLRLKHRSWNLTTIFDPSISEAWLAQWRLENDALCIYEDSRGSTDTTCAYDHGASDPLKAPGFVGRWLRPSRQLGVDCSYKRMRIATDLLAEKCDGKLEGNVCTLDVKGDACELKPEHVQRINLDVLLANTSDLPGFCPAATWKHPVSGVGLSTMRLSLPFEEVLAKQARPTPEEPEQPAGTPRYSASRLHQGLWLCLEGVTSRRIKWEKSRPDPTKSGWLELNVALSGSASTLLVPIPSFDESDTAKLKLDAGLEASGSELTIRRSPFTKPKCARAIPIGHGPMSELTWIASAKRNGETVLESSFLRTDERGPLFEVLETDCANAASAVRPTDGTLNLATPVETATELVFEAGALPSAIQIHEGSQYVGHLDCSRAGDGPMVLKKLGIGASRLAERLDMSWPGIVPESPGGSASRSTALASATWQGQRSRSAWMCLPKDAPARIDVSLDGSLADYVDKKAMVSGRAIAPVCTVKLPEYKICTRGCDGELTWPMNGTAYPPGCFSADVRRCKECR